MNQIDPLEGVHYNINDKGYFVFTKQYHLEKGYCCGLGCLHCPYKYENVTEPVRSELLSIQLKKENS